MNRTDDETVTPAPSSELGALDINEFQHPYYHSEMGKAASTEGTEAKDGSPLAAGQPIASIDEVVTALRTVYDPEIPVNIYDLGLIYDCQIKENGDCRIVMTLTAPACPVAGELPAQVAAAVAKLDTIGEVTVKLTWMPPWDRSRMSEEARMALDLW